MAMIVPLDISQCATEQQVLDAAVTQIVPDLADWAALHLTNADCDLRQRALAHRDPHKVNLGWELERRWPSRREARAGATNVCRTGEAEFGDIPDDLLATVARDGDHLQVLRALGLRSYICVPLRSAGEILGTLTLVMAESGRTYARDDLQSAEALADDIAAALARLRASADRFINPRIVSPGG